MDIIKQLFALLWDSPHWSAGWPSTVIQQQGSCTFHQFLVQFLTGILLFSTALRRLRDCYIMPLKRRVKEKYAALLKETEDCNYDKSEISICQAFEKKAKQELDSFIDKANQITLQRRLCFFGALYALGIMRLGLYQLSYLWTLSALWPFAIIYIRCKIAANKAKAAIQEKRESLATALSGYREDIAKSETDMLKGLKLPDDKSGSKATKSATSAKTSKKMRSKK